MKETKYDPISKTKYIVTIEDEEFITYASTPDVALSNAAWRYADAMDEKVQRIKWQLKEGHLYSEVNEITGE